MFSQSYRSNRKARSIFGDGLSPDFFIRLVQNRSRQLGHFNDEGLSPPLPTEKSNSEIERSKSMSYGTPTKSKGATATLLNAEMCCN